MFSYKGAKKGQKSGFEFADWTQSHHISLKRAKNRVLNSRINTDTPNKQVQEVTT